MFTKSILSLKILTGFIKCIYSNKIGEKSLKINILEILRHRPVCHTGLTCLVKSAVVVLVAVAGKLLTAATVDGIRLSSSCR